jgi:Fe-S cluster biogenesis protein NfuA
VRYLKDIFIAHPSGLPLSSGGFLLILETKQPSRGVVRDMTAAEPLFERVNAALERVRPFIQDDGGEVWLVKIEGAVAYVQLLGACGGCAASQSTLKLACEQAVKEDCPEIQSVEHI